jgi:hypothetical protein
MNESAWGAQIRRPGGRDDADPVGAEGIQAHETLRFHPGPVSGRIVSLMSHLIFDFHKILLS